MIALNRRRVMGSAKLPYDAQIEYLESTGTQYIDTGISPTQGLGFYIDAVSLSSNSTKANVASFGTGNYMWVEAILLYAKLNGHALAAKPFIIGNRQSFDAKISYDNRFQVSFINNVFTDAEGGTTPIPNYSLYNGNIYLYCVNYENTFPGGSAIKVYNFKLYNGSNVILDFIPVRVGNVGYMYDRVSKQLFGNMGTGNFILGPDV